MLTTARVLLSPLSASEDEDQDGLDQAGGAVRAAADLAEDLPALEVGVGALTGSALAGVSGARRLLVVGRTPAATCVRVGGPAPLRDDEPRAAVAVVGDHLHLRLAQGSRAGSGHAGAGSGAGES